MAAEEAERCRPAPESHISEAVDQAGGTGNPCSGNADQHRPEPRKQRHIVVRAMADGRKTHPPPRRLIEEGRAQKCWRDDDRGGDCQREQCWQAQEGETQQACQRDLMQDAEEDESAGNGEIGRDGNRGRRAGHHRQPAQEAWPAYPLRMRQEEADADQKQEARSDAAGKQLPAARGLSCRAVHSRRIRGPRRNGRRPSPPGRNPVRGRAPRFDCS